MRNIELSDSDVQINMLYNSTSEYTTYVLDDFTISGLTAASSYMIKVSFMANEYSKAIVVPT